MPNSIGKTRRTSLMPQTCCTISTLATQTNQALCLLSTSLAELASKEGVVLRVRRRKLVLVLKANAVELGKVP